VSLHNLFSQLDEHAEREQFLILLSRPGLRIERVVSTGQVSPPGFWYEQEQGEWLVLLAGEAKLLIEDEAAPRDLLPGDFIDLPPGCRHRVDWTDPEAVTIWLTVSYEGR
jgi:cupin 2 domain-containing protein